MIRELVEISRSFRRFDENHMISEDILRDLVGAARLTPSARNLQPLRYILSREPGKNTGIFDTLSWAGYLKDWNGPSQGERPSAYIIITGDTRLTVNFSCDQGIVAQTILLAATEKGLGGCIIATIDRAKLSAFLNIPQYYEILLVIALGKPTEKVVIEEFSDDVKYWRDENQVHHVPKRRLEDLILDL